MVKIHMFKMKPRKFNMKPPENDGFLQRWAFRAELVINGVTWGPYKWVTGVK